MCSVTSSAGEVVEGVVQVVEEPGLGMVREMGIPVKLAETPGRIAGPSPRRRRHNMKSFVTCRNV